MEPGKNLLDDADTGEGHRVLVDSADMHNNSKVPEEIRLAFEALVSNPSPSVVSARSSG